MCHSIFLSASIRASWQPLARFFLDTIAGGSMGSAAASEDLHIGYYYPKLAQIEVYDARAGRMAMTIRGHGLGLLSASSSRFCNGLSASGIGLCKR